MIDHGPCPPRPSEEALLGLELVVALGVALLGCSALARSWRIPAPILLLASGALLGLIPALRGVSLPPEAMLLLFLPALLYWESLNSSLREIRSNLRVIVLLSTGLVVATAAVVAVIAHALGLPWGPAWVLGAAIAPTDATAVGVIARDLNRRTMTILRAESLVNDGTALVIYGVAVGATVGHDHFGALRITWLFGLAYLGGALSGLVTAWLMTQIRRRLDSPTLENVVSVLTPFVAFLGAEAIHASGVLAVVICGLALSQVGPRLVRADTRQQAQAFWGLSTFILNGSLFVLVGVQATASVRGLTTIGVRRALLFVLVLGVTLIVTRMAWSLVTTVLIRTVDRRPAQRLRRVGPRARLVNIFAGFRGAVSLAAALAVPETVRGGAPFPDRDVIVFVVSGVIILSLLQGLALPVVVRWARLPADTGPIEERHLAETVAAEEALAVLEDVAGRLGTSPAVLARTRKEYEKHMAILRSDGQAEPDDPNRRMKDEYTALRLELLGHKRATVVRLRDERLIDDTVLRQIQARLDVEEVRLSTRDIVE